MKDRITSMIEYLTRTIYMVAAFYMALAGHGLSAFFFFAVYLYVLAVQSIGELQKDGCIAVDISEIETPEDET